MCVTRYLNYVPFDEENAFRFSALQPFYPNSIFTPTQIRLHEIDDLICSWNQIFSCHTRSRLETFHNTNLKSRYQARIDGHCAIIFSLVFLIWGYS